MRATFSELLISAAKSNPNILLLTGDHGYALFDSFRNELPEQYINCGIAEQNMIGVAAGLAKSGFLPVVYGLSAFVPMRVLEQIKIDICYESLKVLLIGDGAGIVYSHLGASHQCTEDIAALRAIPNISICSPADRHELKYSMLLALAADDATYLRIGKADLGDIHSETPSAAQGKALPILNRKNAESVIIATGSMVKTAFDIASVRQDTDVYSIPCIKPISADHILEICKGKKNIFTFEEHSIFGGLGSSIAEIINGKFICNFRSIGIAGKFSEYCGDYQYLIDQHDLSHDKLRKIFYHNEAS